MAESAGADARYPVPASELRHEIEISRSRFLATLTGAATVDEAKAHIAGVSEEFGVATHNCWAYLVGPPGSTAQVGMSDDGEPHGTAGKPMLNALIHSGLGDVSVVVTRWFGGTKLGKGGLVRAYGGAVSEALARVERIDKINWREAEVVLAYGDVDGLERLYPAHEVEVLDTTYSDRVRHVVRLPASAWEGFVSAVLDATSGRAEPTRR